MSNMLCQTSPATLLEHKPSKLAVNRLHVPCAPCQYKDYFGKPGKGIHSYRIADIAIVDVGFTILVAWLLSYLFDWNFIWCLFGLFILGILMHRLFCVRTKIDTILFT